MKTLILTTLILMAGVTPSFAGSCLAYFNNVSKLNYAHEQVLNLPSGRRMKVYFERSKDLKSGDEIVVAIPGLGKGFKDLKAFTEASLAENKSVFGIELQGHGKTRELNPDLAFKSKIPSEYNVEDLLFVLKELGKTFKLRIAAHSHGGGILLETLAKMEESKIKLPITKVILLSPFVKNLDKYYVDAMLSGQLPMIVSDLSNPVLNSMGVPAQWIQFNDSVANHFLFQANALPQQARDAWLSMNPLFNMWRDSMSKTPNAMANLFMGPSHMIANASYEDIRAWQANPMLLTQLIMSNIALINGATDLNFLDYSKKINLPKAIEYKVVMAMNDSVVPNTINQEFVARMARAGYKVKSQSLGGETHYFLYGTSMKELYRSVILD